MWWTKQSVTIFHNTHTLSLDMILTCLYEKSCHLRAVFISAWVRSFSQHHYTLYYFEHWMQRQLFFKSIMILEKKRIFNSFELYHFRWVYFYISIFCGTFFVGHHRYVGVRLKWMFRVRVPDIKTGNALLEVSSQLSTCNIKYNISNVPSYIYQIQTM